MSNQIINISIIFLCLFLIFACGGNAQDRDKRGNSDTSLTSQTADSTADISLTLAYLDGEWCHAYFEAGYGDDKERGDQNITYIFKSNGKLLYQNNPNTPVEKEGSYKLKDGKLKILPTLRFLPSEIYSVHEDHFMLGNSVTQLAFIRGACKD